MEEFLESMWKHPRLEMVELKRAVNIDYHELKPLYLSGAIPSFYRDDDVHDHTVWQMFDKRRTTLETNGWRETELKVKIERNDQGRDLGK